MYRLAYNSLQEQYNLRVEEIRQDQQRRQQWELQELHDLKNDYEITCGRISAPLLCKFSPQITRIIMQFMGITDAESLERFYKLFYSRIGDSTIQGWSWKLEKCHVDIPLDAILAMRKNLSAESLQAIAARITRGIYANCPPLPQGARPLVNDYALILVRMLHVALVDFVPVSNEELAQVPPEQLPKKDAEIRLIDMIGMSAGSDTVHMREFRLKLKIPRPGQEPELYEIPGSKGQYIIEFTAPPGRSQKPILSAILIDEDTPQLARMMANSQKRAKELQNEELSSLWA